MDEINLIDKPPRIPRLVQGVLLFFGERLAIILFALSIPLIILFLHAPQAFSDEEKDAFVRQDSSWHKNVALQVPAETSNISYSFSTATITPSPSPTPAPTSAPVQVSGSNDDVWEKLAQCESKGNWSINTGNGYYGGLQFSESAWRGVGGTNMPHEASKDEQLMRGKMLQERRGWGPWGACSKKLGLI